MFWRPLERLFGHSVMSDGEHWQNSRKVLQPLFTTRYVATIADEVSRRVAGRVEEWDEYVRSGRDFDAATEMSRILSYIVNRVLFGDKLSREDGERIIPAFEQASYSLVYRILMPFMPYFMRMPGDRTFLKAVESIDDVVFPIVRKAMANPDDNLDVISVLCRSVDENGDRLTEKQIRDALVSVYAASSETTAMVLTWLWLLLEEHPDVAARLQAEIDEVVGEGPAVPERHPRPRLHAHGPAGDPPPVPGGLVPAPQGDGGRGDRRRADQGRIVGAGQPRTPPSGWTSSGSARTSSTPSGSRPGGGERGAQAPVLLLPLRRRPAPVPGRAPVLRRGAARGREPSSAGSGCRCAPPGRSTPAGPPRCVPGRRSRWACPSTAATGAGPCDDAPARSGRSGRPIGRPAGRRSGRSRLARPELAPARPAAAGRREAGAICARAGRSQRDMREWAETYPGLFSAKPFDAALYSTLSLAMAFGGPWFDAEQLRMANKVSLWAFGLDWLVDYVATSPAEVEEIARRCLDVAAAPRRSPATTSPACSPTSATSSPPRPRSPSSGRSGATSWSACWAGCSRSGAGRPTRSRRPSRSISPTPTTSASPSSSPPTGSMSRAPARSRTSTRVREAAWAVQRVIRLLNDLGTYERDVAWGDLNVLLLGVDPRRRWSGGSPSSRPGAGS